MQAKIVNVFSLDFDGCIFNKEYLQSKQLVSSNEPLFDFIDGKILPGSKSRFMFNHHQSFQNDSLATNSSFLTMPAIVDESKKRKKDDVDSYDIKLDSYLLADCYSHKDPGSSFEQAQQIWNGGNVRKDEIDINDPELDLADCYSGRDPGSSFEQTQQIWNDGTGRKNEIDINDPKLDLAECIVDESKFTTVYAQLQKIASENPGAEIEYHFFDDNKYIIGRLYDIFTQNPVFRPPNCTLNFHSYGGGGINSKEPIKSKDESRLNPHYEESVRKIAKIFLGNELPKVGRFDACDNPKGILECLTQPPLEQADEDQDNIWVMDTSDENYDPQKPINAEKTISQYQEDLRKKFAEKGISVRQAYKGNIEGIGIILPKHIAEAIGAAFKELKCQEKDTLSLDNNEDELIDDETASYYVVYAAEDHIDTLLMNALDFFIPEMNTKSSQCPELLALAHEINKLTTNPKVRPEVTEQFQNFYAHMICENMQVNGNFATLTKHFTSEATKTNLNPNRTAQQVSQSANQLNQKLYGKAPLSRTTMSVIGGVFAALLVGALVGAAIGGGLTFYAGGIGAIPFALIGAGIGVTALFTLGGAVSGASSGFFYANSKNHQHDQRELIASGDIKKVKKVINKLIDVMKPPEVTAH